MVATTSSIGAGAKGACRPAPAARLQHVLDEGMRPISKICVQR
jgi:hypothetical protein